MAILPITNQYQYSGRGPFDAKMLVGTYAELLDPNTWTNDKGSICAYNGMITAVWKDSDASLNGVYLFHDPNVTNAFTKPTVSNEEYWHKFCDISAINEVTEQLRSLGTDIEARLVNLENRTTEVVCDFATFPKVGTEDKIYIDGSTGRAYYYTSEGYQPIKAHVNEIYGGSAFLSYN